MMKNLTRTQFQSHPFGLVFPNSIQSRNFSSSKPRLATPYTEIVVIVNSFPADLATLLVYSLFISCYALVLGVGIAEAGPGSPILETQHVQFALGLLEDLVALNERLINVINEQIVNASSISNEILRDTLATTNSILTINELVFDQLSNIVNVLERSDNEYLEAANELFENLRDSDNDLVELMRLMETRLNLPLDERLAEFWFEG
jgi:hypothetical protein